jgi:LPXTG-site transpeptidase (sortase) family protein
MFYNIQIEALDPRRGIVNNLMPHFGQVVEGVLDLRDTDFVGTRTRGGVGRGIMTALKFATTTGFVFAALFIALNWGAYSQKFDYWYRSIDPNAGKTEEQKLLASLLETNKPTDDKDHYVFEANAFEDEVKSTAGTDDVDFRAFEVGPSMDYIALPKLELTVPIQYPDDALLLSDNWDELEKQIQKNLENGVVHYPGTALPGQKGNVFITGHSSYYTWSPGRYKDVFALLPELKVGDEIAVWHDGVRYVYKAYDIQTVKPSDTKILAQTGNEYDSMLTLMTCTPVGTAIQRFIVRFYQLYPDPALNEEMKGEVSIGGMLNA